MLPYFVNVYRPKENRFRPAAVSQRYGSIAFTDAPEGRKSPIYLSPGWIDAHAHVADGIGWLSVPPGLIGLSSGVFVIGEAGSTGANTFRALREYVLPATRETIRVFLHISANGLVQMPECGDERLFDAKKAADCCLANRDIICGVKVRLLPTSLRPTGLTPLQRAKEAARLAGLPVMMHLSDGCPDTDEALDLMDSGDIITHVMHGAESLFDESGAPIPALAKAMRRGVLLDLGNGRLSFDFATCERALAHNPALDLSLSSDIHANSFRYTKSLATAMNRVLACGYSLENTIRGVTACAARALSMPNWCDENMLTRHGTLFEVIPNANRRVLRDATFNERVPERLIRPVAILKDGLYIPINPSEEEETP